MRRLFFVLSMWAGLLGGAAQADNGLRQLITGDDGKGWEAVGRLNLGRSFCTGALIAPDIVLTAAHCLYNNDGNSFIPIEKIEFLAGWRNGRAVAYRGVRQAVVHPKYDYHAPDSLGRINYDVALLQLDRSIRLPGVTPFEVTSLAYKGDEVGVVSYAHDRAETPSIQEVCHVMARRSRTLVLSCDIDFGSSGAPVFSFENGFPQIVSVVSSKSDFEDRKVALGTGVERSIDTLIDRLQSGEGVLTRRQDTARSFGQGGARNSGSAKFVKP